MGKTLYRRKRDGDNTSCYERFSKAINVLFSYQACAIIIITRDELFSVCVLLTKLRITRHATHTHTHMVRGFWCCCRVRCCCTSWTLSRRNRTGAFARRNGQKQNQSFRVLFGRRRDASVTRYGRVYRRRSSPTLSAADGGSATLNTSYLRVEKKKKQ